MKIALIGVATLVLGLLIGAYVGGNRLKHDILAERALQVSEAVAGPGPSATVVPLLPVGAVPDSDDPETAAEPDVEGTEQDEAAGALPARTEPAAPVPGAASLASVTSGDAVAPENTLAAAAAALSQSLPDSTASQGAVQLARMFSAMRPADAAAVLQELTDAEVAAILQHMQSRLSGQILGAFEPGRAALLSRVVLDGGTGP